MAAINKKKKREHRRAAKLRQAELDAGGAVEGRVADPSRVDPALNDAD